MREKSNLKKKVLILSICFFLLITDSILLLAASAPKLELKGKSSIVINIDGVYKEPGVTATYQGKNISKNVKIEGKIDVHHAGTYKIKYILNQGIYKKKKIRVIIVKDIEAPIIELKGNKEVFVCPGKIYEEEGYTAFDNVDGDITEKVSRTVEGEKVIYTVQDKEGNKGIIERTLKFQDIEKPKIELIGGTSQIVYLNAKYVEPGYKVTDNCDLDISSKVKITNNVNMNKVGTYEVIYEVTDASGNGEIVKRVVKVVARPRGGTIYLTFDDGPSVGTTNKILDILKEEGVKATFFVTCNGPDYLIKREVDEGHTVALHTATHDYAKVYASVDAYFNDLKNVHDRVLRITGQDVKIIRFPGGSSNTISRKYCKGIMSILTKEVINQGYHYFDWNIDSKDAGGANSASAVYNNVIRGLSSSNINVILMHDVKPQTRDALRDIIKYAKDNGFKFATITMSTPMIRHGVNN